MMIATGIFVAVVAVACLVVVVAVLGVVLTCAGISWEDLT